MSLYLSSWTDICPESIPIARYTTRIDAIRQTRETIRLGRRKYLRLKPNTDVIVKLTNAQYAVIQFFIFLFLHMELENRNAVFPHFKINKHTIL